MSIKVLKNESGEFLLSFDDTLVILKQTDLKRLLVEIIQAYSGKSKFDPTDLFGRLIKAEDVSIQTLLQSAENGEIAALIKASETNKTLKEKLLKNMSKNSRKTVEEEVEFKFDENTTSTDLMVPLLQLTLKCNALTKEEKAKI
jgi:hypothetical protein